MRSRPIILILTTLTSAARQLAQRPSCGPAEQPKELPTVSFLIDSSAALIELQAAHVLRDSMQFTLLMVPGDSIPVIHALDSTNATAANVLARSVWPEKPADLWAVRVYVTGGAAPALTLSRATYCPPVLTPGSSPVDMVPTIRGQLITSPAQLHLLRHVPQGATPVPAVFDIDVTERGDVSNIKLIRSAGSHQFDQHVAQQLVQQKYEPALLDGIPVPSVLRVNGHGEGPLQYESRP